MLHGDDLPGENQATYRRELARLSGSDIAPVDPTESGYRCRTLDGFLLEPTETVAAGLLDHFRRVVIGAGSVTIDLGRKQRLFNSTAALAVRLAQSECYWPGCHVPTSDCQIDHLIPWAGHGGGRTNPENGGPACGRHNRLEQQGFTTWRNSDGQWHIQRPDGTRMEN